MLWLLHFSAFLIWFRDHIIKCAVSLGSCLYIYCGESVQKLLAIYGHYHSRVRFQKIQRTLLITAQDRHPMERKDANKVLIRGQEWWLSLCIWETETIIYYSHVSKILYANFWGFEGTYSCKTKHLLNLNARYLIY